MNALAEISKGDYEAIPNVVMVKLVEGDVDPRMRLHDNFRVIQIDPDGKVWLARLGNAYPSEGGS